MARAKAPVSRAGVKRPVLPFSTTSGSLGLSCTAYRPSTLGQNGVTHPVILWGNGTGSSPSTYAGLLRHLASHGFIVVAANTSNALRASP